MAKIVTGYTGQPHIESVDWQALNRGIFGTGNYVITKIVPNMTRVGNVITLPAMDIVIQGVHCRTNGTESVTIDYTTSGNKRYDRIVGRYAKSSAGAESFSIEVVKGQAAENPVKPSVNEGDITAGNNCIDIILYDVLVTGTSSISVSRAYVQACDIDSRINELNAEIASKFSAALTAISTERATIDRNMQSLGEDVDEADTALSNRITTLQGNMQSADTAIRGQITTLEGEVDNRLSALRTDLVACDTAQSKTLSDDYKSRISSLKGTVKTHVNDALGTLVKCGKVSKTPSGAGVKTTVTVAFPGWANDERHFASQPIVTVTPSAETPSSFEGISVNNVTISGFDIVFVRNSTASATFNWIAVGEATGGMMS